MKQIAFTWLLCILSICAYAQQITVTGTVTDAENNLLMANIPLRPLPVSL